MVFIRKPNTHLHIETDAHSRDGVWTGLWRFAYNVLKQSPAAARGVTSEWSCWFSASLRISCLAKYGLACLSLKCFKRNISNVFIGGWGECWLSPGGETQSPQRDSSESKALHPQEFQGLDEDSQMTTVLDASETNPLTCHRKANEPGSPCAPRCL